MLQIGYSVELLVSIHSRLNTLLTVWGLWMKWGMCPSNSLQFRRWKRHLSPAVNSKIWWCENQVYLSTNSNICKRDKVTSTFAWGLHLFNLCYMTQAAVFAIKLCVYCSHTILNLHIVQFSLTLNNSPGSTHQQHSFKLLSQHLQ